jgi:PAS domain S-box-containing protein
MKQSNSPTRILIIDDDEEDFLITSQYIKKIPGKTFEIDWCYDYTIAIQNICTSRYDIYFVDYLMSPKTGLELIQEAAKYSCDEPIILLTGKGNHQIDIQAMEAGAFDYQVKTELSVEKMERCIRYALGKTATLKALKTNERKFRSFFEKSKDAVFLADKDLVFEDANSAMTELVGTSIEALQKSSLYDLLSQQKDRSIICELLHKHNEVNDFEIEILTSYKEKKPCILSVTKEKDEHGKITVQGIIHDITNLRKAEKANLQVEKLSATGRLARILAHEIRNPLNNINLSVEQLSNDDADEDSKIFFDIISRNSKTINDLISELLNSSRPTDISLEHSSLQNILDQTLEQAVDRIRLKKIKMEFNYPESPAMILADSEKLKIAFLNIIINSIEAMEEERGFLRISISERLGEYLVLIEDNGAGISEEHISRLFEPYFTSKKDGLGLGLATTLNIIQSHKGLIEVQTKLGLGTSFSMKFKKVAN